MADLERPRSGLSVASSVATISSVSLGSRPTRSVKRVHTFGKREYAIKRDPNSAVVIRGWLYKQDSAGLRLWKRRWFVLSDFCLFYYRDSREETVLGSILLPSYDILPAGPREAKNRKFTFKAEHPGMRTYYFGADTQEDMNSWIRAMNQSALVVAENNNKMGHLNNISSTVQDGYYASYEDFTRSALSHNGEHAKSAESLEIAHLSDTRSQQNSSSDSLLGPDHGGDGESKGVPFSNEPRDPTTSSSEDVEQFTPASQHGGAPPSTPVCGVKKVDFTYDLLSGGSERLVQRKESISQVEEWVCLQKEKLMVREFQESLSPRIPSGQVSKSFENPHERYPPVTGLSYVQTVSPSSPSANRQLLPVPEPDSYDPSMVEGGWERKEEAPATTWPESPRHMHTWLQSTPLAFNNTSRPAASPPVERANIAGQAPIRASRSYSLPPTPSDLPRPRAPPGGISLDEDTVASAGRGIYYSVAPQAQKPRTAGTPSQREVNDGPKLYHHEKGAPGKPHASSCEELDLIGSSSPNRKTLMRPHTPMGRVDMHPSEDSVISHTPVSRNPEEKHSECYITSTSTRNRGQLKRSSSRPQTPADRYDVLPSDDTYSTLSMARTPGQAIRYPRRSQHPGHEDERPGDGYTVILAPRVHGSGGGRMQYPDRTFMVSPAGVIRNSTPRLHAKMGANPPPASPGYSQLPPLPPFSSRSASHVMPGKRISLALPPHSSGMYRERMPRPVRMAENETDVLLTRLCGQDKLLQSLEEEFTRLRTDKEKLENVLEVTRLNLAEFQGQEHMMEKIWYQQRMLQDDLVHIRARLCDVSLEKERAWEDYRVLENDLQALRETLEHVRHVGHPQDQAVAQRDLWMINDIISGLRANKNSVYITPDPTRHPALVVAASPADDHHQGYQQNFMHISGQGQDPELIPPRPPLPRDHATVPVGETEGQTNGNNNNQVQGQQELTSKHPHPEGSNPAGQRLLEHSSVSAFTSSVSVRGVGAGISSPAHGPASPALPRGSAITCQQGTTDPEPKPSPPRSTEGGTSRKQRMSAEEQLQRMRRHQEAQIHERVKPGPTLSRQGSQRNSTTNGGSQMRPQATESQPDSPSAESPDRQKPSLVKVTSNYYPITLATSQKTKAAWFLEAGTPNGGTVAPRDKAEEETGPQAVVVVNVTSRSSQEMLPVAKVSPPVRTSSKLITATHRSFRTGSNSTDVQDGGTENMFEFPNHLQGSLSTGTEPGQPLSPEKMEYRRGTREPIKNMASASPGTSPRGLGRPPDEMLTNAPEGQRERIMSLSYTLATEASQRSKLMTAKALADEYSDDSVPEDAEDWDFLLQEVYSCTHPDSFGSNPQTPSKSTADRRTETEQPGDPMIISQGSNSAPRVTENSGRHLENKKQQHLYTETTSDGSNPAESASDQQPPWDCKVGCYENWTVQERLETREQDRGPSLKRDQVSSRISGCNGRVTNCGYQLERVDFAHADLDKVVGYLKEPEDAIRVTVLQSSF